MTGYGDAARTVDGIHYAVDVRSLNNKYFKAVFRLPEFIQAAEAELDAVLRRKVSRGSITVSAKITVQEARAAASIDQDVLSAYLENLENLQQRFEAGPAELSIDLSTLLTLPGVMRTFEQDAEALAQAKAVLVELAGEACDRLLEMRRSEGKALARELADQRDVIRSRLKTIEQRAPEVVDEYHQRLRTRIDELTAKAELEVNQGDLLREVALYADRSDIREEVQRLGGHLDHFEQIIKDADGEPSGRTLDFLAQELLREANTIASKSNDAAISRAVVEAKSAIDRIKEQVQNVE